MWFAMRPDKLHTECLSPGVGEGWESGRLGMLHPHPMSEADSLSIRLCLHLGITQGVAVESVL